MTFAFNNFNNIGCGLPGMNCGFGPGFLGGETQVKVTTTGGTGSIFHGRSPRVTTYTIEEKSNGFMDFMKGLFIGQSFKSGGMMGGMGMGIGNYSSPYGLLNSYNNTGYTQFSQYDPAAIEIFHLGQYNLSEQGTTSGTGQTSEKNNLVSLANNKFNIVEEADGTFIVKHKTKDGVYAQGDYNTVRDYLLNYTEEDTSTQSATEEA